MTATLSLRPLDGAFGVEVSGVDRRAPLDAATRATLADVFHSHQALLFRGDGLSPREYVAFVRQFGDPDPSLPTHEPIDIDGFKGLRFVSNIVEAGAAIGQFGAAEMGWHQDRWTDTAPPAATVLYGAEIPARGGATAIANLCDAYDRLPDGLKAQVEGRTIHFPARVRDPEGRLKGADIHDPALFVAKPLVQTHAVTGRMFLFLGARRIQDGLETSPRISGLAPDESEALLDALFDHLDQPDLTYSHAWKVGDLLIWDNRCCAHRREAFDNSERRLLYASPLVASDLLWQA